MCSAFSGTHFQAAYRFHTGNVKTSKHLWRACSAKNEIPEKELIVADIELEKVRKDKQESSPSSSGLQKASGLMKLVQLIDEHKEKTRELRRTVFTDEDWVKFRSSERIFENIKTTFNSILIQGLWLEIAAVTVFAFAVYGLNKAIFGGFFEPYVLSSEDSAIFLPALPFQLSSPALGLLLVFRTNTVYTRWNAARIAWENVQNHCNNLARQGMAYLKPVDKEEYIRRVVSLAHVIQRHFRTDAGEEERLQSKLTSLLGVEEAQRVMRSKVRPIQAMSDISRIVRRTQLDGSTRNRFDLQLDELNRALLTCEGLRRAPVPLVYTRHTERFLGIWTLLLPMALIKEMDFSFAVVPMSGMVGLFLFGIEEIGVQLEEPFSVLPIEDMVRRVEEDTLQMLAHEYIYADSDPALSAGLDRLIS
jgi:ion channel-forming bestrophin family protein